MSEAAAFPDPGQNLEVSPWQLRNLLEARARGEAEFTLVDCREEDEHAYCRIDGDQLMPLSNFVAASAAIVGESRPVVIYCHHGMRSAQAAQFLRSRGNPRTFSLAGGIELWSREIDPLVPRY